MKNKNLIEETKDFFGVIYPYVCDDEITDKRIDVSIHIHHRNGLKSYFAGVK